MGKMMNKWPPLIILFFLILSFVLISSDYNHVSADAGIFARCAHVLYTKNKIDTSGSAPILIGQLLFTNLFSHIFGFSLKNLHILVYLVDFLILIGMYLLLLELGLNRFLSLFGSLTLFISPISLRFIDWYMTEPFFMFYLIFSLLFYIKGLRRENYIYLYIGSIFCVLSVLTRQYGVSISLSLIFLCFLYRGKIKRKMLWHSLISASLPIIAVGSFYLLLSLGKITQLDTPHAYSSAETAIVSTFTKPLSFISRLYIGSLYSLHYSVLYLTPLFIILLFSLLISPKNIKKLFSNLPACMISLLYVSIGTLYLYIHDNRLMPYLPSVFSIGNLTRVFSFSVLKANSASYLLTLFTWFGSIIVLQKTLASLFFHSINSSLTKDKKIKKKTRKLSEKKIDFGLNFFYFWGISYLLLIIFLFLKYDRYILPISTLMIYIVLSHFSYIGELKKTCIVVFILIFSVFIFKITEQRLYLDLQWEACNSLMNEGVSSYAINGGLGYNNFYSFDHIHQLYKQVKRPINWHLFHPMAQFFVTGKGGLEHKKPGLMLYKAYTKKRFLGLLERKCFIYQRKREYLEPIWL